MNTIRNRISSITRFITRSIASTSRRHLATALAGLALVVPATQAQAAYQEGYLAPTQGWRIMQPDYPSSHALDAISFEWDYFMIHSDTFNGIVGYVLANPRHKAAPLDWALLPLGNNVGIVGEIPGQKPIANYVNMGLDNSNVNGTLRGMTSTGSNGQYIDYRAMPGGGPNGVDALHLRGRTPDFEWDLIVTQDMADRDWQRPITGAFTTAFGSDIGVISPSEFWNVDMIWPRTNVNGWVKTLGNNQVIQVNGKGYRENSWGRYMLSVDGWDFLVFGEDSSSGVMGAFQTYHKSAIMDNLDLSFYDQGQLQTIRYETKDKELGWYHPDWKWDGEANSCVPTNTKIRAKNGMYTVDLDVAIGNRQRPMLTNMTVGTSIFFIQEHFPTVTGTIRRANGSVVKTFTARAGGEFARTKDIALWHSGLWCNLWGDTHHKAAMP